MNQNSEAPIINSPVVFPCPIPADRIQLIGLRLKKGANVSMSFDLDGQAQPEIILSRRDKLETINFDDCADWAPLPSVTIDSKVFAEIVDQLSSEKAVGCLLTNILSAIGTVSFELLFEENGDETNRVIVSIKAGEFETSSEIDLAEIIEFVGETTPGPPNHA